MGETNVLNKWFLYTVEDPFTPVFWLDKYFVYFDDEASANRLIAELSILWEDSGLEDYLFISSKEILFMSENTYNITNCYPKEIEVRNSEEEDWHYETHLFDRDTDEFIL